MISDTPGQAKQPPLMDHQASSLRLTTMAETLFDFPSVSPHLPSCRPICAIYKDRVSWLILCQRICFDGGSLCAIPVRIEVQVNVHRVAVSVPVLVRLPPCKRTSPSGMGNTWVMVSLMQTKLVHPSEGTSGRRQMSYWSWTTKESAMGDCLGVYGKDSYGTHLIFWLHQMYLATLAGQDRY
jgi:hypothetical protein